MGIRHQTAQTTAVRAKDRTCDVRDPPGHSSKAWGGRTAQQTTKSKSVASYNALRLFTRLPLVKQRLSCTCAAQLQLLVTVLVFSKNLRPFYVILRAERLRDGTYLVELAELAELVPEVTLFARAAEVPHPHLRSGHVSHVVLCC